MTIEKFYHSINQGMINMSSLASELGVSLPTIYNRRKTKSFTVEEKKKLIDMGLVTPSDTLIKDWGTYVLEMELLDNEEGGLHMTDPVIYDITFDHWYALKKLNQHG